MLHSLLRHPSSTFLAMAGFTLLASSCRVYSDTDPLSSSHLSTMNVSMMSSEDLLDNAAQLSGHGYFLDEDEANQYAMNAQWLKAGMEETPDYYEGDDAVQELIENALQAYWKALVRKDQRYDRYTPVVEGHLAVSHNGTDYDVRFSGDTLKFRIKYEF